MDLLYSPSFKSDIDGTVAKSWLLTSKEVLAQTISSLPHFAAATGNLH